MSRLIVKNLPKGIKAEKLQEIFSEKGVVTDVQLKYTKDGRFRHFGFIGYKNEEDARKALEYFNNTFINSSRVKVEQCAGLGDPNKPKAWSKYAPDSTAYKKQNTSLSKKTNNDETFAVDADTEIEKHKTEEREGKKKIEKDAVQEALEKYENDPLFAEFLEARTKGNKAIWSNIGIVESAAQKSKKKNKDSIEQDEIKTAINKEKNSEDTADSEAEEDEKEENLARTEISDSEYLKRKTKNSQDPADKKHRMKKVKEKKNIVFYTVKIRGISYNAKKKDVKLFFHPLKPKSIRIPVKMKGIAYVGFGTEIEMKQALKKHLSFLGGRRIMVLKYGGDVNKQSGEFAEKSSKWKDQEEGLKEEEAVAESGRIFVRNLAYTTTEDDIEKLFNKYGPVAEVTMPVDRYTRKTKGYAVVTFMMPEHATKAYMDLDGKVFQGRMLHLLPGKMKKTLEELLEMEGLSFKQKKVLKMKAQAAASHNWNALFLGQNSVADLIAKNYNTPKEKVLDATGKESLAVRLALGETQIVNETKEFLLQNGVHLDAFNQAPKQRSKTVILVKNLPADTTQPEIREMFAKFGELGRVLLPPSGVTAIVEFLEPSEARNAFRALAYTKFKYLPLYLEWAPSNTFGSEPVTEKSEDIADNQEGTKKNEDVGKEMEQAKHKEEPSDGGKEKEETKDNEESSDDENEPEPDTTLFVKNLNFVTREDALREHFKQCGPIHYVIVATKKDAKKPSNFLSLGYGFIQFRKKASAEKALKTMQHTMLDDHSLELKRSHRTLQSGVKSARKTTRIGKQTGSKILVRNVPFQAKKKEIRDLFSTFGEIKSLRLPEKMAGTGSHRGFAFVEFLTKHDAKRAFKALSQSTHLYGRRLVLEWAETEENLDHLRQKAAQHVATGSLHYTTKKAVADMDIDMEVNE